MAGKKQESIFSPQAENLREWLQLERSNLKEARKYDSRSGNEGLWLRRYEIRLIQIKLVRTLLSIIEEGDSGGKEGRNTARIIESNMQIELERFCNSVESVREGIREEEIKADKRGKIDAVIRNINRGALDKARRGLKDIRSDI